MNKLLQIQTIKENDEEFLSYFNCEETEQNTDNLDALSYITQSRIKELEALVEMMKEELKLSVLLAFNIAGYPEKEAEKRADKIVESSPLILEILDIITELKTN